MAHEVAAYRENLLAETPNNYAFVNIEMREKPQPSLETRTSNANAEGHIFQRKWSHNDQQYIYELQRYGKRNEWVTRAEFGTKEEFHPYAHLMDSFDKKSKKRVRGKDKPEEEPPKKKTNRKSRETPTNKKRLQRKK